MNKAEKIGLRGLIHRKTKELEELMTEVDFSGLKTTRFHVSDYLIDAHQDQIKLRNSSENTILYVERLQNAFLNLSLIADFVGQAPPDSIERHIETETFYDYSFEKLLCSLEKIVNK